MKLYTFVGCSYTVGVGLEAEKLDSNNYTNIVSRHFNTQNKNLALPGNSNYNIFFTALNEILFSSPDVLFVQWSHLNRLIVYPAPGLPGIGLHSKIKKDYKYNNLVFPKKMLQTLVNSLYILNHDYHHLTELVNYSKILETVSKKTRIVFINGGIPWTTDLLNLETMKNYSNTLSKYSQELFDFNNSDDHKINQLFIQLHNEIQNLNQNNWVNMFSSFIDNAEDLGNDSLHPGPKSHKSLAKLIINHLT